MSAPMTVPLNDLSRLVDDEICEIISSVVRGGRYINGSHNLLFEMEFSDYIGACYCAGVGNGTDALELALLAAGVRAGDRVMTVANAGGYSSIAIKKIGAHPIYADVDDSLTMDPSEIDSSLNAVVATHLYGRMAKMNEIRERCSHYKIPLIEDCAQAIGASQDGKKAGAWGDVAAFSFFPTKNLGALGDGGAVLTNTEAADRMVRRLREYGWSSKYEMGQSEGMNSRLDELQAAVLRHRLRSLDDLNRKRQEILKRYASSLSRRYGWFNWVDGEEHVAHLAVIVCANREKMTEHLSLNEIATDIHYPIPDHRQGLWSSIDAYVPHTDWLAESVLTIPCFPTMTEREVDHVCGALRSA